MKYYTPGLLSFILLLTVYQHSVFGQTKSGKATGYGKASYGVAEAGTFMKSWLLAGPFSVRSDTIEPDEASQEMAFKEDQLTAINVAAGKSFSPIHTHDKEVKWEPLSSITEVVDLDAYYKGKDFAYVYARAEIKSTKPATVFLGLGSDDGVKVWLNGKLVHNNWIPRAAVKDNDLVSLKLVKGSNQLLLKVQNIKGGWSFVARLLDKAALTNQLSKAAAGGNLDQVALLLDAGADVNGKDKSGTTPIVGAKLSGRKEVVQLLLKKGAVDQPVPSPETLINAFYTTLNGKEAPGVAVLLAKEGNVLYKQGFGYADIKNKVLITPDTKFRIGSVTKQFTAAAILTLQENGLLSVEDKLSKFIPDFPRGDEVTIHHLLTHTSGIHSYTSNNGFIESVTKTISPDSLVAMIKKDSFDFNPGERFLYNNSGYFLLGYIIGKVSGKPYAEYLKETFFTPLQMTNTGVHSAGIQLENEAKGYTKASDHYEAALNWDMSWAGGAGSLYSTVDDLLKWNQALYGGKVLNEKSLQAALTPVVLKTGEKPSMPYAYGLGLSKYRGVDVISHGGGLHGFVTQLAYYPKEKISVVMFSNTAEPEVVFNPHAVAETYLWNKMESQNSYAEASVKPKDLQQYVGRYELSGIGVMHITTEENKLYAQLSGQPTFEIFPLAENEFFWKVVDARLKFFKNEKGEITQAILFQNSQELAAKKLKEETIVAINPAVLDNYTGKYKFNNSVVTLSKEGNRLFAQPTDQPKLELLPVSETEFVIKELNARIFFVKEASGKVNKFRLNMNGSDTVLPRLE